MRGAKRFHLLLLFDSRERDREREEDREAGSVTRDLRPERRGGKKRQKSFKKRARAQRSRERVKNKDKDLIHGSDKWDLEYKSAFLFFYSFGLLVLLCASAVLPISFFVHKIHRAGTGTLRRNEKQRTSDETKKRQ